MKNTKLTIKKYTRIEEVISSWYKPKLITIATEIAKPIRINCNSPNKIEIYFRNINSWTNKTVISAKITEIAVPTAANLGTRIKFTIMSTTAANNTEIRSSLSLFNGSKIWIPKIFVIALSNNAQTIICNGKIALI